MIHKITVEQGRQFGNSQIMIDGLIIKDHSIPVLINFDRKSKPVAMVKPFIEDGAVKINLDCKEEYFNAYPAVGIKMLESVKTEGIIIVTKSELFCIGLSTIRNDDPEIKTIGEQIND